MKKLKNLRLPLLILLLFLTIECTPNIPNVPVCENLPQRLVTDPETDHMMLQGSPTCEKQIGEPACGHCTYIVTGREIYIGEKSPHFLNGKAWSQIKLESVYVPAVESYGPLSDYIINSCKKMKCNDAVDAFKIKIDSLNGMNQLLKTP